jgi:autotransporter-associated beta strand protein
VDTSGTLTLESAFASPTINVSNQTATIQAVIDGTNGFTKLGAGTLVLSGANIYSGVTTQSVGTLTIGFGGVGTSGAPTSGAFGVSTVSLEGGTLNVAAGGGRFTTTSPFPQAKP